MHAIEIIVAVNAAAAGITVEQNLAEAKSGQFINSPILGTPADGRDMPAVAVDQASDQRP
ncbi:MAG: hypothetical protein J0M17_22985 [Planctomycetes bacterium]|nr:hypothetical protein [Planctomycetota bacterium]